MLWDNGGFVLYYKRLEEGRFRLPTSHGETRIELDGAQLSMLLDGIDLKVVRRPKKWIPPTQRGKGLDKADLV